MDCKNRLETLEQKLNEVIETRFKESNQVINFKTTFSMGSSIK